MNPAPLRIGISACLLGEKVRYDGGHKRNASIMEQLVPIMTFVPVCPEVEVGMGVPREPIRLERGKGGIQLVGVETRTDHTEAMTRFSDRRAAALEALDLSGYILKKDSPSCGPERVRVYGRNGVSTSTGRGLFARSLMERLPLLPVEDEGRLADPDVRRNFIERIYAYRRVRDFFKGRWTQSGLLRFHASEKPLLLARDPRGCASLDRLVGRAPSLPRAEVAALYQDRYMRAFGKPALRSR
jgi:uncharacterized protein YbbK (DUF523 family)